MPAVRRKLFVDAVVDAVVDPTRASSNRKPSAGGGASTRFSLNDIGVETPL